jgi:hypothetical protein
VLRAKLPALATSEPRADVALYYTQWRTLLRALGSLENYRRSYGARLEPELVVPFLLFDPHSPRSLRYGTEAVKGYLERIAGGGEPMPATRLVGRLHADLLYQDERLAVAGADAVFLDRVIDTVARRTTPSPRSTSSPDHAARRRARFAFGYAYISSRSRAACSPRRRPTMTVSSFVLAVTADRSAPARLERQRHPPLHDHLLPRPHRGGAGRGRTHPAPRAIAALGDAVPADDLPTGCSTSLGGRACSSPCTARGAQGAAPPGGLLGEHVLARPLPGLAVRVPEGRDEVRLDDRALQARGRGARTSRT